MSTDTTSPPATRSAYDYPNVDPKTGRNAEAEAELERLLRLYNTFESDCKFDIQIYGAISDIKSHVNATGCTFGGMTFRRTIGEKLSSSSVVSNQDLEIHVERTSERDGVHEECARRWRRHQRRRPRRERKRS